MPQPVTAPPSARPAPVRLGVTMLCHDNLELAARMARLWTDGGARIAIHVDAKAPPGAVAGMQAALDGTGALYARRRPCEWGTFSLVEATLDAARLLLDNHPDLTHVMAVSGACLPLRPVSELCSFLARHQGRDFIESVTARDVGWTVGGLNEERFTLRFPFSYRRQRRLFDRYVALQRRFKVSRPIPRGLVPHLGSQWWCLTAETLRAILGDPRRPEWDRYFRRVWVPDESYFQTLVRRHSIDVESRSLTLAKFDTQGKPYVFYDDHLPLLVGSRAFVARKIWPGAQALYDHFPVASPGEVADHEPHTDRLEALLDRAADRRLRGRPGLYMQSRFPRKDAENGKTARPYAVIYGFGDLFPGLAEWLEAGTGLTMHRHLLAPDQVEFAQDEAIGPGALSDSAAVRDLDPRGFLTSLIRSSPTEIGFLFSPRDRQSLNWFMATDPNARIHVATGAWIVPMLNSGMPFDDIRRAAALIQRAEIEFLSVLDSVWVKARVSRFNLADVIAQPQVPLRQMVHGLTAVEGTPGLPLPAMRNVAGVVPLLRRLANAGLRPRRMGDLRTLRAVTSGTRDAQAAAVPMPGGASGRCPPAAIPAGPPGSACPPPGPAAVPTPATAATASPRRSARSAARERP
ncbi:beta-1,6-N-acetylglucosaminyltransferase [Paracoccus endophyticus]|uniref:DUF5927 domain-containing protein n=1 Tax=Paracoccus endophyticus TaxID=2233774 RepID=UPI000DDAB77C|nr:beta-1,6-N-acetylglucosaminyltransferase [Paracoccus endophyticus]